ncbi:glycerophosphodiester phosphodiesterase [Lapillicoccus jejuensis]|uniref:Glycerophosphoryl diester phosphodiesterase n=1 Tax=Lapillicoccus jejuensis TaxID=402171 RepID=A0A542E1L6_9MICO|nr:glycerophosphodiester phosphodiesterase [Lapillicoccus jejuensis]TQJ09215.1 glycerophosphoryl diester phosphodiesterase [Lapillicoccus jejuensis]
MTAAQTSVALPRVGQGRALAVGHRGDPVAHRENTLPAVRAAIEAGVDLVEVDLKTSADGVSVLLHDDRLTRLWELDRGVRELTAAELADLGGPTDRPGVGEAPYVPRLEQALRLLTGTSCGMLLDLTSAEWVPAALDTVRAAVAGGTVRPDQVAWCGGVDALRLVREADDTARVFLTWGEELRTGLPDDALVEELRPESFNPHWQGVVPRVREWCDERGLGLSCWTVDDRETVRRVLEEGAGSVTSNRVPQVVAEVAAWNAR